MSVNPNYTEINIAAQQPNPKSILNYWKHLIRLRKEDKPTWIHGAFDLFNAEDEHTIVYGKVDHSEGSGSESGTGPGTGTGTDKRGILVALNFSTEERSWGIPEGWELGDVVVGNLDEASSKGWLKPWEAVVYAVGIRGWDSDGKI